MSWQRGLLFLVALGGMRADAQEQAAQSNRRRLVVPRTADPALHVPEVRVAWGMATMLHLPTPVRPGALILDGTKGKVKAIQVSPTDVVLSASEDLGSERIPLTVPTEEGRRHAFMVVSQPTVWDSEVTVAFEQSPAEQTTVRSIVEALMEGQELRVLHYQKPEQAVVHPPGVAPLRDFFVKRAVRLGSSFLIVVKSKAAGQPWAVQEARLEGSNGEVLKVLNIFWGGLGEAVDTNVIVAEVPKGVAGPYTLRSIQLTSRDGRVDTLNRAVDLP